MDRRLVKAAFNKQSKNLSQPSARIILLLDQNMSVGFMSQKLTEPIAFSPVKTLTATRALAQWGFDVNPPQTSMRRLLGS